MCIVRKSDIPIPIFYYSEIPNKFQIRIRLWSLEVHVDDDIVFQFKESVCGFTFIFYLELLNSSWVI